MSEPRPGTDEPQALLIAAHGDRGGARNNRLALEVAERMSESGRYDAVGVGYIRSEPSVEHAAAALMPARLRVYPLFMSDGYYVRRAIPQRLGLGEEGAPDIRIDPALGLDPELPELLAAEAEEAIRAAGAEPLETTLLEVAHGSSKSRASADAARGIAARVKEVGRFRDVECAFLEEEPFLAQALEQLTGPLCLQGLFIGQGMHGAEDLPEAVAASGRQDVVMAPPLAESPRLVELVCRRLSAQHSSTDPLA
ncbi:MAG: CbiX/SirB N-terminal domain-containing protein [Rhodovibrionaceae bacterium]|nr:CbiX/SirB N-terminal domain-containing protein [Rhodovibrionaceae bacterium]